MFIPRFYALCLLLFHLLFAPNCWAIVCYHCDSIAESMCAMTLGEVGQLPYIDCANELTCIVSIVDSITYRGCGSDTPTLGASYMKSCSSNLCNAGVYPPGRLKCHHCAGESCVDSPTGKPRPCLYHHEFGEDQCYTEVLNATSAYRGCVSDSNHTITTSAQYCEINGCNDAQAASTLSCARCDSLEGRGCKIDLFHINSGLCNVSLYDECHMDVLLTQHQSCFTYHKLNRVVRGCTAQLPPDIAADTEHIVECDTSKMCNLRCTTQQQCLSCDTASNELCRTKAEQLKVATCGSAEASSCYACEYEDLSVRRGCGTTPTAADIKRCYECDANDGCNALAFTRCYKCSSDETGAGCATWERPGGIYIEECQDPGAACVMAIFTNGTTVRGCQSADFHCNASNVLNCRSCEGSFCNKNAFPEQRIWCHQCTGGQHCEELSHDPMPCAVQANEPDDAALACLEYYDDNSEQVMRGCRTDAQLFYKCMLRSEQETGCQLCHSNGCNSTPVKTLRRQSDKRRIGPKSLTNL